MTQNRTYVVTGGASGIGLATARLLAAQGATVIVGDINTEGGEAVARNTKGVEFVQLNLEEAQSIIDFAETVLARHPRIDGVVNAAGWDKVEPFMSNEPALWDRLIAINLMGTIRVTRAFLPGMIEAKGGKIVTVSSDAGRVGSMGETVYSACKGGIIAFTKSLSREMARYGINVNCICPGPTDTPLLHSQTNEWAMRIREGLVRAIPFRRLAKPEEIADGIEFFLSPQSDYVTGQVLSVSGGLTMVD